MSKAAPGKARCEYGDVSICSFNPETCLRCITIPPSTSTPQAREAAKRAAREAVLAAKERGGR